MVQHGMFVLVLREQVVFPMFRTSVTVQLETFKAMCDFFERNGGVQEIGAVALKQAESEPYSVGTCCRLAGHTQSTTKSGGSETTLVTLALEGLHRIAIEGFTQTSPFHVAIVRRLEDSTSVDVETLALRVRQNMTSILEQQDGAEKEKLSISNMLRGLLGALGSKRARLPESPSVLADIAGAGLKQLAVAERQKVLETTDLKKRLEFVLELTQKALDVRKRSKEIFSAAVRNEEELRETVLRRQLKDLHKELRSLKASRSGESDDGEEDEDVEGEDDDDAEDVSTLKEALAKANLSEEAQKIAQRELRRLQNMRPQHPEFSVLRNYLETLSNLPWAIGTNEDIDLVAARECLDRDHYGLEQVKKRILEFLAVRKLRNDMKGPILCLHGPPGVGKTSLGRSIASALGRKFHRIALGGVRDEAELRGHRRTYIGSMPGSIIQSLISLKVNNPVILLDEIDKLTHNARFNPAGAMLELLDPEQNSTFKDHYVGTPFDLSKVLFLCTCNDLQPIDRPLLDRMEVIELSGYTVEEKVHIAATHLVPKQLQLHALEGARSLELSREALLDLVTKWTMESGVRSLERRIAQICRWSALRLSAQRPAAEVLADCGPDAQGVLRVDARHLPFIIGAEAFMPELAERLAVGVAMGLAVTSVGGQLLFIEATRNKGTGRLTVTGQLGDVMRESVTTAMSLLRSKIYSATVDSRSAESGRRRSSAATATLGIFQEFISNGESLKDPFGNDDLHVHFPAGAVPKDGPSAGVATVLSLASLLLNRPMRSDTAVTGEVTLRGLVLPVGGIRDKVLAAHRAGIRHVLLPEGNRRHADEHLSQEQLRVELHFVRHIDEALCWAFDGEWAARPRPGPQGHPVFASKL